MGLAIRYKNKFVKLISKSQSKLSVCMELLSLAVYYSYLRLINVWKKKLSPVKSANDYMTCFPAKVKLPVHMQRLCLSRLTKFDSKFLLFINKCDRYLFRYLFI